MPHIQKVQDILEKMGYTKESIIGFTVKRYEKLDNQHVKLPKSTKEKIKDVFDKFHKRTGIRAIGKEFPSSVGQLKLEEFIAFLRDYDEKFDINWCDVELKEITLHMRYI